MHRQIEDMASHHPEKNSNDDIRFVVDDSKRCAPVQTALSDATSVATQQSQMGFSNRPSGCLCPKTPWRRKNNKQLRKLWQRRSYRLMHFWWQVQRLLVKMAKRYLTSRFEKHSKYQGLPSDLLLWNFNPFKGWKKQWGLYSRSGRTSCTRFTCTGLEKIWRSLRLSPHEQSRRNSGAFRTFGTRWGEFCASGTMELDLSKGLIVNSSSEQRFLLYGAFFTDCTHSVQEVTIGWRVVVQSDDCEEIDKYRETRQRRRWLRLFWASGLLFGVWQVCFKHKDTHKRANWADARRVALYDG